MINYRILGGLGNQIFQVLDAIVLANKYDTKVVLDFSSVGARDFHLDYWKEVTKSSNGICVENLQVKNYDRLKGTHVLTLGNGGSLPNKPGDFVYGWTPNVSYFERCGLISRGYFLFDSEESDLKLNEAAIHFRRGDYLQSNLGIPSDLYYNKALKFMRRRGVEKLTVFSDDLAYAINWVQSHSESDMNIEVFESRDAISTLYEMSKFPFSITSNSTFSFWAHYFGGSISCFPFPFYTNVPNYYKNLYCDRKYSKRIFDVQRLPTSIGIAVRREIYSLSQYLGYKS